MQVDGFHDVETGGINRSQRTHRFLEDHGDMPAADFADGLAIGIGLIQADFVDDLPTIFIGFFIEGDLTLHLAGFGHHVHDGLGGDRFAAAALADDAQGLPAVEIEAGAIDGMHDAIAHIEFNMQVFDGYQRVACFFSHWFHSSVLFAVGVHCIPQAITQHIVGHDGKEDEGDNE